MQKKQIAMTALKPTKHHPMVTVDNDSDSKFANKPAYYSSST